MKVVLDSGQVIDLGATKATPTIGITDYSRRVTDDFGVTTVVERGFSRTMSVQVAVPFDRVDELQRTLAGLRATPAQWVADDRFASLSIRGFYKEFSIDVATSSLSFCTLSVEGLAGTDVVADAGGDPAPEALRSTLQLLRPIAVAGAQLVASNVAEADAPEWAASKAYPSGVRVIKAATHRIYESLAAVPAGDDPVAASGKWLDVGPTNRWAMFDQALGSVTTANGSIAVAVDVGAIDAVAVLDVVGATVRVQATDYDRTVPIVGNSISLLDLPNKAGRVTVTITGNGTVSAGTLLVGHRVALGLTEAAPTAGITDYSRKVVDDFGEVTVVERAWAKRMTANSLIRTDAVDAVANRIAAVRAQPVLWIGRVGTDSLTIYGFFKDFSIEIGKAVSKLSLSIEGLSTAGKIEPLGTLVEWPDIADPIGTKPANNADKTSENTSKDTAAVGGRPSGTVIETIDKARADIDDLIETVSEGQTDLSEQVNAANDARDAAQTARDQSQAARDAASAASTLSGAARDAAKTAQTNAEAAASTAAQRATDASDYAQTATGQATIATQKADAAGQSASNASASASTASTKAGEASTSAQSAVTAKNDAAGSATSAGTSAGVATQAKTDAQAAAKASSDSASGASTSSSAAGQSATAAAGSATAAGTSAGNASSSAGQASSSAADALGSKNSAASSATVAATTRQAQQDDFARTQPATFAPGDRDAYVLPVNATMAVGSDPTWPQAYITQTTAGQSAGTEDYVRFKKLLPRRTGRRYRVTTYFYTYSTNMSFGLGLYGNTTENWNDGSQSFLGFMVSPVKPSNAQGAGSGWIKLEGDFHTDQSIASFYSPRLVIIPSAGGVTNNAMFHTTGLVITDITSERAASDFAAASNTSASSAAASRDAAGTSASAANQSKLDAQTALGGANAARDTAVTSASNAAGSANTAASSATLSARTANDAAGAALNDNRNPGSARSLWSYNQYNTFAPDPSMVLPAVAGGPIGYNAQGELIALSGFHIHPTKPSKVDPTRRIRCFSRFRQVPGANNADTNDHSMYLTLWDKDGNLLNGNTQFIASGVTTTVNGPELVLEAALRPSDYNANTAYIRLMYRSPAGGQYTQVNQVYWIDDEGQAQARDSASAAVSSASAAKTSQDGAGASAVAANQSRIDAQAANGAAQSAASIAQSSAASADASRSQAQTSASLIANYSSNASSKGEKFGIWQDGQPLPAGWGPWVGEGNYRVNRVGGAAGDSPYSIQTLNDVANVESGFMQVVRVWPGVWIMEATVKCDANNMVGSGLTLHGQYSIDFAREKDTKGVIDGGNNGYQLRTFSKAVFLTQAFVDSIGGNVNFHCMHSWSGFGGRDPRYMTWAMARLRPANGTDTQALDSAARIEEVNRTLADQYGALAQRVSTTEATAGNLSARTGITESAVADLRTKSAAARLEFSATSPGGRAAVTIRSDSNNGAGIDLVGDVAFTGNQAGAVTVVNGLGVKTYDSNGNLVFQCGIY